jgi:hypothetical protein
MKNIRTAYRKMMEGRAVDRFGGKGQGRNGGEEVGLSVACSTCLAKEHHDIRVLACATGHMAGLFLIEFRYVFQGATYGGAVLK